MFLKFLKRFFSKNSDKKYIQNAYEVVGQINALEEKFQKMTDAEMFAYVPTIKQKISNGCVLNEVLPETFALVREAGVRSIGKRHFDVQLIGGMVLHDGDIAEMPTGEGKTLVATLAAVLNALLEKGVHIITTNPYLAGRDSESMGKIYNFLGLSVSCVLSTMSNTEKRAAYRSDIIYGTNSEFGFDYLRDHLHYKLIDMVQEQHYYAIIDEADSILIDEGRTPLIISGASATDTAIYQRINDITSLLTATNYEVDHKNKSVQLTDDGAENVESIIIKHKLIAQDSKLYDAENLHILHHIEQALKAQKLFKRDVDYIVKNGTAMIIDEFTGRVLQGRRYSDGLHQAIEAKEGLAIQPENEIIASITLQNYFRMYDKIAGMTGTAKTEERELQEIYSLNVRKIPPNKPLIRVDEEDVIFRTEKEKNKAIVSEIMKAHSKGQPVLIGTVSVEKSELISNLLEKEHIPHKVLNAKHDAQEAEIISDAGRIKAVTVATNMAGRGTDIELGGKMPLEVEEFDKHNEDANKVKELGGLLVIGTERHESRRIDQQLRGRAGRQGDPGRSIFFLSLEDDLMKLFGSAKLSVFLQKLGIRENEAITHPWITKAIQRAQQKVEMRNFELRKNLIQYDDVINKQRKIIYAKRLEYLTRGDFLNDDINATIAAFFQKLVEHSYDESCDEFDVDKIQTLVSELIGKEYKMSIQDNRHSKSHSKKIAEGLVDFTSDIIVKLREENDEFLTTIQNTLLSILDAFWREHLKFLEYLRIGINLRSYGQKNPLHEYNIEAFNAFQKMKNDINDAMAERIFMIIRYYENKDAAMEEKLKTSNVVNSDSGIRRNAECPCGSGKRYKHCHGKY
ncbi:Protein translocase subunit SecA [Candidatus Fokinia solitaria]|uniref:Protein translocase subunit SecA n=1 Tax=Candidatus Fokinia solitaria TaxID=1802984 RepID=A0A2U8BSC0_9RICK|nr:preprotein translocase subunit SecA [Candidatus Fokinia solitaria]AWD33180.1 Protein translocase subunit SecA [Candidatus Fokinia solitaria]